jgi:hypothetical protein
LVFLGSKTAIPALSQRGGIASYPSVEVILMMLKEFLSYE